MINLLIIYGISELMGYFNTGADRSTLFHGEAERSEYYTPEVTWISTENPGRKLDPFTQQALEKDYLNAWYVRHVAFAENKSEIIEDYYTASAREVIKNLVAHNSANSAYMEGTSLSHNLDLNLFSADGNLAIFTDRNVATQTHFYEKGMWVDSQKELSDFKVVMLLEDGFWRIRHIEKIKTEPLPQAVSKVEPPSKRIEGFNYYPRSAPWNTFSADLSLSEIRKDFELLRSLGLNTIRTFVGYEDFGKAQVSPEKLNQLILFLDLAHENNIDVVVTLFDFYGDYSIMDWSLNQAHAIAIVEHIKSHPALLAWDIKNEPDLDFESRGEHRVISWLEQMTSLVRKVDPHHPITIGWSHPNSALMLSSQLDIISFHYYEKAENLGDYLTGLREKTDKPLFVQELGMSTYSGIWNPFGNSAADQASYYAELYKTLDEKEIHYLFWTLHDFKKIPDQVAGNYPWRKKKQQYFGIMDSNQQSKPAMEIIINRQQ